ncbi:hypothetical protein [Sedimentibacter sp. zth1]|nr:hypothetical protein [Sedimentibacter sp. zth1]
MNQIELDTFNDNFNNIYSLNYSLEENISKYFIEKYNMEKIK